MHNKQVVKNFLLRIKEPAKLLLFLMILCFSNFVAQENIKFCHIPLNKGLSNKSIPAIIQDKKGYLWFATQDGLNRYDGYSFKVYQNDPADKNSLSNNNIFCLFEDSEGILWAGTEGGGLNRFDPETEIFTQYLHQANDPASLGSNQVYCISEGPGGELWLGTWDAGISIFNKKTKKFRHLKNNPADPSSLAKAGIWQIYFDSKNHAWISLWGEGADCLDLSSGRFTHYKHREGDTTSISNNVCGLFYEDVEGFIWISTWGGGLNRFDPATKKFRNYLPDPKNPYAIGGNKAWPIVEDKAGNLWIGVYGSGLNRFDRKTGKFTVYAHNENDPGSLAMNNIWSLFIDRSGIVWIGTEGGGIDYFSSHQKQFGFITRNLNDKNSLAEKSVRGLCADKKGNLWMATWLEGIDCMDKNGNFMHFKNPDTKGETGLNRIKCVYSDDDGKIWFGTYRGGLGELDPGKPEYHYYPSTTSGKNDAGNFVINLLEDSKKRLWVASLNELRIFDKEKKSFTTIQNNDKAPGANTVNKIFESRNGNIWLGTNLGLYKFDGEKIISHPLKCGADSSAKTVYDIYEDADGILWLATRAGLVRTDQQKKECRIYKTKQGLPVNTLFSIQSDSKGNLWISSAKGLSKFMKEKEVFINYDLSDGLNNLLFYPASSCKSADGTIYFGGSEGVSYFNPDRISDNDYVPPVYLTGFLKFDEHVNFKQPIQNVKQIELNYDENVFTFLFVGLNYDSPEKNQYAFKLDGFDKDWRYAGTSRRADYSGLQPGKYFFRVKASNNDGTWNESGASVELIIQPPFWETLWFKTTVIVLILLGAWAFYTIRVRTIRKRNILLEKTVKERTEEVVQQKEKIEEQRKEMVDSIQYAKRIQTAILPSEEDWNKISEDHFVLFRPKDIVSGDFFWCCHPGENKALWAVADCTGHGVPGAFMSMIGSSFLNEIVVENKIYDASTILNTLRAKILKSLEHKVGGQLQKDGMDLALCVWDKENSRLEFGGANNPLYLIREGVLQEIKPNKMPIGHYIDMQPFQSTTLELKKGDTIYAFSDGYADQFGGSKGKKFKYSQMKELFLGIQNLNMREQSEKIAEAFENWKGKHDQIDDVCIVGIRVT